MRLILAQENGFAWLKNNVIEEENGKQTYEDAIQNELKPVQLKDQSN